MEAANDMQEVGLFVIEGFQIVNPRLQIVNY
jgi:hypothetical protein